MVVSVRRAIPISGLLLLGALAAALGTAPTVAAECHCVSVSCVKMLERYDDDGDGRILGEEKERMDEVEGLCPAALIRVIVELLDNDLQMTGFVGGDEIGLTGSSNVSVPAGGHGTLSLSFELFATGNATGTVRFLAAPGVSYDGPTSVPFDTAGDAVAHIDFEVDEEAGSSVAIPFTVSRAGMPDHPGMVVLATAAHEETATEGDLGVTEIAVVAGIVGAVIGAILASLAVVILRK